MTGFVEYELHKRALHGVHTMLSNSIKNVPNATSGAATNSAITALGASMAAHPVGWAIGATVVVAVGTIAVLDSLDD